MEYAYQRGLGASKRVMHLTAHNSRGDIIGTQCGARLGVAVDTYCNLPLGRPTCKHCIAALQKGAN